jgi:hypothetical protein
MWSRGNSLQAEALKWSSRCILTGPWFPSAASREALAGSRLLALASQLPGQAVQGDNSGGSVGLVGLPPFASSEANPTPLSPTYCFSYRIGG